MFRRKKNKGAKSDDMVALTGPDVLSSSSGPDPASSKSKRFLGLRKKKTASAGKGGSGSGNGKSSSSSSTNNVLNSSGSGTKGTGGTSQPIMSAADNHNMQLDLARKQKSLPNLIEQHYNSVPESIPQAMSKRAPSNNKIVGNTNAVDSQGRNLGQWKPPQLEEYQNNLQQQQRNPQRPPSDVSRGSSSRSSNIMARDPSTASKSVMSAPREPSPGPVPALQSLAAAPTPTPAMMLSKPPPPPHMVMNGGNNDHVSTTVTGAVPIMRSGWSIQSNASSAMNSEHYIQSLDNLPTTRAGKEFPMLSAIPDDSIQVSLSDIRIRSALSRQFGRSYPPRTFQQKWYVKVGKPKWDEREKRHKYKINITRNPSDDESTGGDSYSQISLGSTSANRSLQDFLWLEQALRSEYHGAVIVPMISLSLYFGASENLSVGEEQSLASLSYATDATSKGLESVHGANNIGGNAVTQSFKFLGDKLDRSETVDETILADWLSDVINGVRGNGEVILKTGIDAVESEAMETFLYRHSETPNGGPSYMGNYQQASGLGSPFNLLRNSCNNKSLFENFMDNSCGLGLGTKLCGPDKKRKAQDDRKMGLSSIMCSSGATGVPGLQNCNSYLSQSEVEEVDSAWLQASSQGIATHSELLEAERDIIASYLQSSSLAMSKVQSLTKDEVYVGQCWKRFAISLSNLFSVEKDLEQAHIGDQIKSNKKNQPFRKLRKSAVDDALRVLAKGKIDRSNPSLRTLGTMLNAYYADLNSIVPAFREYSEAINQLHQLDDIHSAKSNRRKGTTSNQHPGNLEWSSSLEHLKHGLYKITGGGSVVSVESDPTADDELSTLASLSTTQTKALQTRVLSNETMLKFSVTIICKSCPLRNARMAWWYLKTEAKQASDVHTAASALRQRLIIDADAAKAMKERKYDQDEKKDNEAEIELVKRILDIGDSSDKEASRQNALRIATEQVGRWNAKTALALMEAAGVVDAEVQIDETSRELRHVRKYAISLRENVSRCLESAEALAACFILNSDSTLQISRSRREFWAALSTVYSGKIITDRQGSNGPNIGTPSTRVLSSAGIDVTDRGGWLGHNNTNSNQPNPQRRNCGEAARQYLKKRDNQANILLSRVIKLLKDYERRLEGIESFVYMHCVGIQLEKSCSRARSKALSAWEKRTDISTAINVATKKKIPKLVQELKVKLDALPNVSHTTVIKRKEEHLTSKTLKSDLHKLANRRFGRAQEVSTERVIAVMSLWARHEESVATDEVNSLGEVVQEVELSIQGADVDVAYASSWH